MQKARVRVKPAAAGVRSATLMIAKPSAPPIQPVRIMIVPRMIHTIVRISGMAGTEFMMTVDQIVKNVPYRSAGIQVTSCTSRVFMSVTVAAARVRSPNSQAPHAHRLTG